MPPPLDSTTTSILLAEGFCFICANCLHLHQAFASGASDCGLRHSGPLRCGGPRHDLSYPSYKGPLSSESRRHACFICGDLNSARVIVSADGGILSLCGKHARSSIR